MDLGTPKLVSRYSSTVVVVVDDINDLVPICKQNVQNVTLFLPTFENIIVATVKANDIDTSTNNILRYDIIEGNEVEVFSINSYSGVVTTRYE